MREVKFRAWDGKRMSKPFTLTDYHEDSDDTYGHQEFPSPDEFDFNGGTAILLQFTGLKDKNGKEIYEGDILKWGDETGVVKFGALPWDKGGDCVCSYQAFYVEAISAYFKCNGIFDYQEIVGNIYENPELVGGGII